MKFTSKAFRHEPPLAVEVHNRDDEGVNIMIEGFCFLILDNTGTFRFNKFTSNSPMGQLARKHNLPTVSVSENMLTLVVLR